MEILEVFQKPSNKNPSISFQALQTWDEKGCRGVS